MSILDRLFSIVAPYCCVRCNREGALLCIACKSRLTPYAPRCYGCNVPSVDGVTCHRCLIKGVPLTRLTAALPYNTTAKALVGQLKFLGSKGAADVMTGLMPAYDFVPGTIVTHAPTSADRIRQRGYDQAAVLAKAYARRHALPYVPCLFRLSRKHQVGKSRTERIEQMQDAFAVGYGSPVSGRTILLVDDVFTTGATIHAAAAALYSGGVEQVEGIVFARA